MSLEVTQVLFDKEATDETLLSTIKVKITITMSDTF